MITSKRVASVLSCTILCCSLSAWAGDEDDLTPDLAKKIAAALNENKITLAQAIATAEASCKGQAVLADCEFENGKLAIGVYCVAGDKVLDIDIDAKTGKAGEAREVGKKDPKAKKGEEDEDDITPEDARKAAKFLTESKLTLTKAMTAAEESCKGKAVLTMCEIEKGNLNIAVFCLAGDKLFDIDLDGKTGKVTESREVKPVQKSEKKDSKEPKKP